MKGLFQCPPWAMSFCPFRACGVYLRKLSAKIPQASAMKACFQIAERRISSAKIIKKLRIIVRNRVFFVLSSFSVKKITLKNEK